MKFKYALKYLARRNAASYVSTTCPVIFAFLRTLSKKHKPRIMKNLCTLVLLLLLWACTETTQTNILEFSCTAIYEGFDENSPHYRNKYKGLAANKQYHFLKCLIPEESRSEIYAVEKSLFPEEVEIVEGVSASIQGLGMAIGAAAGTSIILVTEIQSFGILEK